MHPEYLHNNDTQQMCDRVCKLAISDEPALRAQCQEVSHQTDTSSLAAKADCVAKTNNARAVLKNMAEILKELSQSLTIGADVFRTRDGKEDFSLVCRAVTEIEEERLHLLTCITELTQVRQTIFATVADANRALHFLKTAKLAVPDELRAPYTEVIECAEGAYARLTELDCIIREAQTFYMTFIERHLSVFMERFRSAADFNHAGATLDRGAIRALCNELLILINRAPNIAF